MDPLTQLPPATHNGPVSVAPAQLVAPHGVLTGALHVPEPSQSSTLHVAVLAVHSAFGSVPATANTHAEPAVFTT